MAIALPAVHQTESADAKHLKALNASTSAVAGVAKCRKSIAPTVPKLPPTPKEASRRLAPLSARKFMSEPIQPKPPAHPPMPRHSLQACRARSDSGVDHAQDCQEVSPKLRMRVVTSLARQLHHRRPSFQERTKLSQDLEEVEEHEATLWQMSQCSSVLKEVFCDVASAVRTVGNVDRAVSTMAARRAAATGKFRTMIKKHWEQILFMAFVANKGSAA
eukprot:TRINITY_DN2960_c0_g1_i3.p1 TRINITY_DN2960_c0_g1~~TRINITY_DN2960_c0_g1_i3.p1  ORF type:complete len:218 (+),score=34.23 TRINITY_DN2960_c0_g1_i3:72-725(+)